MRRFNFLALPLLCFWIRYWYSTAPKTFWKKKQDAGQQKPKMYKLRNYGVVWNGMIALSRISAWDLLFPQKNFNRWFLETKYNTLNLKQNYKMPLCKSLVWWWSLQRFAYYFTCLVLWDSAKGTLHYPFTHCRKQYNHAAWNLQERSHRSPYVEQVKYGNCKINNSFSRQQQSLSPLFEHSKCT